MKKGRALFVFFYVTLFLIYGREAFAVKGWLERLTGPGPFAGWELPTVPILCWDSAKDFQGTCMIDAWTSDFVRDANSDVPIEHDKWLFLTFTYSHFKSQENQLEYEQDLSAVQKRVTLQAFQFSLDYRILPALDIGMGLGINKFTGEAFDDFWRASFDPVRVVWRPVAFFVDSPMTDIFGIAKLNWRDLVQVKFRATHFMKGFEDTDFGAIEGTFQEKTEIVFGWSVTFGVALVF